MSQTPSTPRPEDWANAVANASDLVREDEAAARKLPRRPLGSDFWVILAGILVALAVALVVPRLATPPRAALADADQTADLREEVAVLVAEIEAYRAENGTLPPPAMFAPYLERGYQYQITDPLAKRFLVRRFTGEAMVTYDGSLPLGLWLVLGEYPAERN